MKKLLALYLFLGLSWCGVFTPGTAAAAGQKSDHIPTGKIVEFSLLNLKESLQKTLQKNDRLAFENAALRKDIRHFERILDNLTIKKAELLNMPLPVFREEKQVPYFEPVDLGGRAQRAEELISVFERDIMALKEKVRFLEDGLDERGFASRLKQLIRKKQKDEKNIARLGRDIRVLEKENKALLRTIETLEEEQMVLERQISMLRDRSR